ncbi:MAG: sialidase family protein [Planctomycetia bacterium]|nr:sialidase family protein [Planctomycetia bacterium]
MTTRREFVKTVTQLSFLSTLGLSAHSVALAKSETEGAEEARNDFATPEQFILWTNPQPLLRSLHSYFPGVCELDNGELLASHFLCSAFESVDGTARLSRSRDKGQTWELLPPIYDKSRLTPPRSDTMKPTNAGGGNILLFGYEFFREDPELPMGNPETGGVLDDRIILARSADHGSTWTQPEEVPCRWGHHVEASAPLTCLANGDWATPIAPFPDWSGARVNDGGRLLRSSDRGTTWNDDAVTIAFGPDVAVYEQRLCQLEKSGRLVVIAWNENLKTGERMNNHYVISDDNGKTFSKPQDTGVRGQASSVCALDNDRLLALHAKRRDTDRPGIYGYVVNLKNNRWDIEKEGLLWEPDTPITRSRHAAEIFAFLKFGQPSAVRLADGSILVTFWCVDRQGQGMTNVLRLNV